MCNCFNQLNSPIFFVCVQDLLFDMRNHMDTHMKLKDPNTHKGYWRLLIMIKTIAHLADIHIRKLHRFVEYRQVFKNLYKQLKELKPDAIYIGGDVVHGKLDTSPEEVRMVANFFLELCKIAPTIIIPGNHDCNLNNKSREDTLSPIVDLVQKITPNLHYWKKTGVYTMDNVDFATLSIFDIDKEGKQRTDTLPNPKDLKNTKIALFHGGVDKHLYDNNLLLQMIE